MAKFKLAKAIPWTKRFGRASKKGLFNKQDIRAAKDWHTCAWGEKIGFPVDVVSNVGPKENSVQRKLGKLFYESVQRHEIITAQALHKIILRTPENT